MDPIFHDENNVVELNLAPAYNLVKKQLSQKVNLA
jgi:hypothetical protein